MCRPDHQHATQISFGQVRLNEKQVHMKEVQLIRGDRYAEQQTLNIWDHICVTLKDIKWPFDDGKESSTSVRMVLCGNDRMQGYRTTVIRRKKTKKKKDNEREREPTKLDLYTHTLILLFTRSHIINWNRMWKTKEDLFVIGVITLIIFTKIYMVNHDENRTENTPNDLSSAQEGQQFSFFSLTISLNQPLVLFNSLLSLTETIPRTIIFDQKL